MHFRAPGATTGETFLSPSTYSVRIRERLKLCGGDLGRLPQVFSYYSRKFNDVDRADEATRQYLDAIYNRAQVLSTLS